MDLALKVQNAVIKASTTFREDQYQAYQNALELESNPNAHWVLELLVENARLAQENRNPLCDDTGIPHVLIELGENTVLPENFLGIIKEGIRNGLRKLPGRPMAVSGADLERIEQSKGLYSDPGEVVPPAFIFDELEDGSDRIRIHVLMLGGGPEIRASTYRVFHQRDYREIFKEASLWLKSELPKLGCTPCIPALGIGRTHVEASTLMLKAMAYGNLLVQSELELNLTQTINSFNIGALNMGGNSTALGSFINIGPQRASGVRILSIRPCCCVEPRAASIDYKL